ncbi:RNA polymerase sigma factor family, partial [Ostertagia ostertagi]
MKKSLLVISAVGAMCLGLSQQAMARDFGAIYQQCGLGGAMNPDSPGWAVSTNITWDWGTTAIMSDVSSPESCKGGSAKKAAYIHEAYPKLAQDLSRGEGKHLTALMTLAGCSADTQKTVATGLRADLAQLYALLYPEIKRVARIRLAQSGHAAGLNTTALVHEGFLRMADQQGLQGETRGQFFAYVGRVLRSVVIDHLRGEGRDKRGGDAVLVTLSAATDVASAGSAAVDMIGLDRALNRMQALDRGLYELIEMVAFAGLTIAE